MSQQGLPEYNILLLGETGAGKSTTINAFANYLKYRSFSQAKTSPFTQLISSKFTIPHPETGAPFVIHSGATDANERPTAGTSSTQAPIAYSFTFNDRRLRIIDTPGIGDTRGVTVDVANFDRILASLYAYKELHGICILIKAIETRKTAFFKYCITELLTRLHPSALERIFFCFTFSRNCFYGPGDGFGTLKGLLEEELKQVPLQLKPKVNCFFIDNEAYRFLVAQKQGYPFPAGMENDFEKSWKNSVSQTNKMWKYICEGTPHDLSSTESLNNLRKIIVNLAEPMAKLTESLTSNQSQIAFEEKRFEALSDKKQTVSIESQIEVDDVEVKNLPASRIVCTAAKCTDFVAVQGQTKVNYKTVCAPNCTVLGAHNIAGDPQLKEALGGQTNCPTCGCYWQVHMLVNVEYTRVKRSIFVGNRQREVENIDREMKSVERSIVRMKAEVKHLEGEYTLIRDVNGKLASILSKESNLPYNPFIDTYLQMLINEEVKKVASIPGHPKATLDSLRQMADSHQQLVSIFTRSLQASSKTSISFEGVGKLLEPLVNLRYIPLHVKHSFSLLKKTSSGAQQSLRPIIKETLSDYRGVSANPFASDRYFSKYATVADMKRLSIKNDTKEEEIEVWKPVGGSSGSECLLCGGPHQSTKCDGHSLLIRQSRVRVKDLCPVCLVPDHGLSSCSNRERCAKCRARHCVVICDK